MSNANATPIELGILQTATYKAPPLMIPPNELQAHLPVSKKYIQLKAPPDTSPPPNVF